MNSHEVTYIGAFIAGLLSFLSPCVLPLIPSFIMYITGISYADMLAEHPSDLIRKKPSFTHYVLSAVLQQYSFCLALRQRLSDRSCTSMRPSSEKLAEFFW